MKNMLASAAITLVVAFAAAPATPAAAQSPSGAAATDSVSRLDTVKVEGRRGGSRSEYVTMLRGNRYLALELRRYDRKIDSLEKHLDSLRLVAANRWGEVRELESDAAATRGRREALERRLAELEAARGKSSGSATMAPQSAGTAAAPSGGATPAPSRTGAGLQRTSPVNPVEPRGY